MSHFDLSAAVLSNRETSISDFRAKLSPKVIGSTTILSNQFMSPWWPLKSDWSSGTITYNFQNRIRLSVDARRNDGQGKQLDHFDFELAFLQVTSGKLTPCHCRSLKRIENASVASLPSTNISFLSVKVCVRQTEGPVNVFFVSFFFTTSFILNAEHNFSPYFFRIWSKISFLCP